MKKIIIFIVFILLLSTFLSFSKRQKKAVDIPSVVPLSSTRADKTVKLKSKNYSYALLSVPNSKMVKLVINSRQQSSNDLLKKHSCKAAVNGGFYTTNYQPLGLVVIAGKQYNPAATGELLNGFLLISEQGIPSIEYDYRPSHLALQSGPILIKDSIPSTLAINNDEPERRIVAAVSNDNILYVISIYDSVSRFLGPRLGDVPRAVQLIGKQEKITFHTALNLDGGTASFFKNDEVVLREYKTIGTLLCVG